MLVGDRLGDFTGNIQDLLTSMFYVCPMSSNSYYVCTYMYVLCSTLSVSYNTYVTIHFSWLHIHT